jgi:hypothetical protein
MTRPRMTKAEQDNLLRLGRLNREGAIAEAKRRTADAAADAEMRLASEFSFNQRSTWAELMRSAKVHVATVDQALAEDCRRLGIPENFRPEIVVSWFSRGENATNQRRTELRRVIHSRLVALERTALGAIEEGHRKFATAVLTSAIDTTEARALLAELPTAEQLMPQIDYNEVKRTLLKGPEFASLNAGLALTDESDDGDE